MSMQEESAVNVDVLLFGNEGEELVDFKCFRGDRASASQECIEKAITSGLTQHKDQPDIASDWAPEPGIEPCDMRNFIKGTSVSA